MKPAPAQQASLSEFLGAKGGAKSKASTKDKESSGSKTSKVSSKPKQEVKSEKIATESVKAAEPTEGMEVDQPERKVLSDDDDEAPVRKRVKRNRVDLGSDEGSDGGGVSTVRRLTKRKAISTRDEDESSPPPISSAPPSSPPPDDPTPSSPPKKSRAKSSSGPNKPEKTSKASKKDATDVAPKASLPPQDKNEKEVEEIEAASDEDLVDEEGASKRKNKEVASKTAELALAKMKDVDFGWKDGETVPYAALAQAFSLIEATTKRLEITAILTAFLTLVIRRATAKPTTKTQSKDKEPVTSGHQDVLQCVYLCINRLAPDYTGIELGIGESLLVKAIGESTGRKIDAIKDELKKEGDLGLVAMNSRAMQKTLWKPKPLTLPAVFKSLLEIAQSTGHSSQNKKIGIITKLLAACLPDHAEAKYIIRSLEGKLRIRLAERTVLVALAQACVLAANYEDVEKWSKEDLGAKCDEGVEILKAVYSEIPSYDIVIPALLMGGMDSLRETCKLTPGIPLKPMLAKPTKAIGEVLDKFENTKFTCEYKYDGERAQVHRLEDGTVAVFSRNSEDMSKKYPDLVEQLPRCFKESTKSFVLDAEAVAIDKTTKKLLPFQELSKRKRKDVKVEDIQVRVCLFGFDLLYLNGESLLRKTLEERRKLLREHFTEVDCEFAFAKASDGETTEEIQVFLEESVKDGCEGLMVKTLTGDASRYEPSRRSVNWLKLKKDYLAGIGDSLDLVVVGAYYGKGKRTKVYGAFLLACYDPDAEEYQTICKIGTGFSDEALAAHYAQLQPLEQPKPWGNVKIGGAKPDIWFEPKVVWEVLTADLSLSPVYEAARGLVDDRGISLRFPRFIRVRDDKSADDATEPSQIAEMYERQSLAQNGPGKKKRGGEDDDFW
ncbi:ATP-dependent DNA ligase [Rhizoctonia solani]|uniref:DNA ligase n=1 Tax=Rhizoctonia solani TaxID=456999 RepID=A0A8H8NYI9_9AGAM|nr:ATP-dependent DNA ligase [Rhizoctonia solani]QRW20663.1 ATP-dependent DNA ligase [Rhizoctonia solani]